MPSSAWVRSCIWQCRGIPAAQPNPANSNMAPMPIAFSGWHSERPIGTWNQCWTALFSAEPPSHRRGGPSYCLAEPLFGACHLSFQCMARVRPRWRSRLEGSANNFFHTAASPRSTPQHQRSGGMSFVRLLAYSSEIPWVSITNLARTGLRPRQADGWGPWQSRTLGIVVRGSMSTAGNLDEIGATWKCQA
jgi:hypothetical protein